MMLPRLKGDLLFLQPLVLIVMRAVNVALDVRQNGLAILAGYAKPGHPGPDRSPKVMGGRRIGLQAFDSLFVGAFRLERLDQSFEPLGETVAGERNPVR